MSAPRTRGSDSVLLLGAGKVGRALFAGLRERGGSVSLRPLRGRPLPRRVHAALLVLCVRDRELGALAGRLRGRVSPSTAVLHVAGALGPEVLAALRGHCAGIGQAHPLLSFASRRTFPEFRGAHLLVSGDRVAVERARALAKRLGMVPRTWPHPDLAAYHAAAGILANGTAALASAASRLLVGAGCPEREAGRVLGPLLHSVADNIERLGLPEALTGPIRRGDAATIERHLSAISDHVPDARPLYLACARAQLPLARALGEAPAAAFSAVERMLIRAEKPVGRGRPVARRASI